MREMLFRGKTTHKSNKGEFSDVWVFGDLLRSADKYYIHPLANTFRVKYELAELVVAHEVDPATIGQYTGLMDKNGNRIFEGDILCVESFEDSAVKKTVEVGFDEGGFCADGYFLQSWLSLGKFHGVVIGNTTDNPELLQNR